METTEVAFMTEATNEVKRWTAGRQVAVIVTIEGEMSAAEAGAQARSQDRRDRALK